MTNQEQMLRVPRVAKMLDVSKKRIYQLIQEGRLEAIHVGPRQTRVLIASLEAFIEELKRRERVARGEELPGPPVERRQRHRVQRANRPPQFGHEEVKLFFGERTSAR